MMKSVGQVPQHSSSFVWVEGGQRTAGLRPPFYWDVTDWDSNYTNYGESTQMLLKKRKNSIKN